MAAYEGLNKNGLTMKPCFTPLVMGNASDVSGGCQHLEHKQLSGSVLGFQETSLGGQFT